MILWILLSLLLGGGQSAKDASSPSTSLTAHLSGLASSVLASVRTLSGGATALGDGTPLPDALLLASCLLADAGHLGASRATLVEAGLSGLSGGAPQLASGRHRPLLPLALHAADTLARVGDFGAASLVHTLLLQDPSTSDSNSSGASSSSSSGSGSNSAAGADVSWGWARALYSALASQGSSPDSAAAAFKGSGSPALPAAPYLGGFIDAVDLGVCPPAAPTSPAASPPNASTCSSLPSNLHPSSSLHRQGSPTAPPPSSQPPPTPSLPTLTRLLAAATLDRQMGAYAAAQGKLEQASSLVLAEAAGSSSSSSSSTHCALPVLLLQQRLLAGARRSAHGIEAALGDWRWLWAPSSLAAAANASSAAATAAATAADPAPPPALPATTPLSSHPLYLSCSQLTGSAAEAGGWGDVARAALLAGRGSHAAALALWARLTALATAALGAAHPDTAAALHALGLLQAAAGQALPGLLSQRRARAGLLAAHSGNASAAERSLVYIRSLLASAEGLLGVGQVGRALRYLASSSAHGAGALGLGHPLTATALSLHAMQAEEVALQGLLRGRCGGGRGEGTGGEEEEEEEEGGGAALGIAASGALVQAQQAQAQALPPRRSPVCSEAAAIAAARATAHHYAAAAAAWAAMPASSRAGNLDYAAFTAHSALAALRCTPSVHTNASLVEAGALWALVGGFNAYTHLQLEGGGSGGAAGGPGALPALLPPPASGQLVLPTAAGGAAASASSTAGAATTATATTATTTPPLQQLHSSLAGSLGGLVSKTLALEGDHTGAKAFLASLERAMGRQAGVGGNSSSAWPLQRSPSAIAADASALALARASLYTSWHAAVQSGKGGGEGGAGAGAGTDKARQQRRERNKLLAALSAAADFYHAKALSAAEAAGVALLPVQLPAGGEGGLLLPSLSKAAAKGVNVISAAQPAKAAAGGGAGAAAPASQQQQQQAAKPAPAPPSANAYAPAVDPYSFDTFLGDGRGYFASQDAFASAQQSASAASSAAGSAATGAAPAAAPAPAAASALAAAPLGPLNALLSDYLPQVALHYFARVQGLAASPALPALRTPHARLAMAFLRYGLLAHDCSFPLPPVPPAAAGGAEAPVDAAYLRHYLESVALQCSPGGPRAGVPPSFLGLFQAKGLLAPRASRVLTRAGRAYFEALLEEAALLGLRGEGEGEWDLVLATSEAQLKGCKSESLARLVGMGMPFIKLAAAQP